MFSSSKDNALLAMIRNGQEMSGSQKLNLIVQLSIPSILAQLTTIMMFYIDASMVGLARCQGFGVNRHCGVHNVAFRRTYVGRRARLFGAGGPLHRGQRLQEGAPGVPPGIDGHGAGHRHSHIDMRRHSRAYFTIYCLSLPVYQIGILSSSMLKSSGNMRVPSVMSILMCLLDVVFNFFLIYETRPATVLGVDMTVPGAGMGVPGAALGTALAYIVTGCMLIWFATVKSPELSLRNEKWTFAPMWNYLRNAAKVSLPMGAQYMMMSGAQIVSTMIVAPLGNIAIAANTLAITAESLCYMPGYGIGDAATTLVGQSIGAGRRSLARSFAYRTVFLGMGVMAFMGMVMYIFAPEMIGVMTPDEQVRLIGSQSLRIEAFAEPMFAAAIVAYSVCLGAGDTLIPATMNLASMWLVRLTLAAHLAPTYGLRGVWMAMAIELTLRGTIFLIRLFSGKWLKKGFK